MRCGSRISTAFDLPEARAVERLAVLLQHLEREPHILGRQRVAVREAGAGIEVEGDGAPVLRHLDRAGDQAVERERLVGRAHHQALEHVARHHVRRDAEDDQGVEAVEGALEGERDSSALRRLRIGIGQVLETGREGRLAMHRDAMPQRSRLRLQRRRRGQTRTARQRGNSRFV